jgi:UDP-N-acetylmuramoyl-L-alanyl-D-glutamate--2,6-diaminopimelate ligase
MARIAVVNKDDESFKLISNFKFLISKLVTYGISEIADINPKNFPFETKMIGEFNVYNSLAAIAACKALGISDEDIRRSLKSFKPPVGREDVVYEKDFTVMIDFAHTPNAFEQILRSVRPMIKGRLIHVFGSSGLRDMAKRPLMGKISSQYADVIVLTSEDPRSEKIEKINDEIKSGIDDLKKVLEISDRKKAIETAIKMAKKGDFVIMTGKSHEKSMNYGHGEVAWDEYGVVREGLRIKD